MKLDTIVCMDNVAFLQSLDEGSIDLVVTSPPYDNLRTYNGFAWDFEALAAQLYRVLKKGGVLVWVVGDSVINGSESLTSFKQAIHFVEVAGFKLHDTMIYQKERHFPEGEVRYWQVFEYMFVLSKGAPKTVNLLKELKNLHAGKTIRLKERLENGKMREKTSAETWGKKYAEYGAYTNVWHIPTGFMKSALDEIAFEHPAIFPEELARRHILTWSNEGDIVLDPFMGSGTVAKMARNLNRHYLGCDISPEYVALAEERLRNSDPYQAKSVGNGIKQRSLFEDI